MVCCANSEKPGIIHRFFNEVDNQDSREMTE